MTHTIHPARDPGSSRHAGAGRRRPRRAQDKQVITMIAAQYTDDMQPYFDQLAASFEEANPDSTTSRSRSSPGTTSTRRSTPWSRPARCPTSRTSTTSRASRRTTCCTRPRRSSRRRSSRTSSRRSWTTPSTRASSTPCRTSPPTASSSPTRTCSRPRAWRRSRRPGASCWPRARPIKDDHPGHHPAGDAPRSRGGPGRVLHLGRRQRRRLLQGRRVGRQQPRERRDPDLPQAARRRGLHAARARPPPTAPTAPGRCSTRARPP